MCSDEDLFTLQKQINRHLANFELHIAEDELRHKHTMEAINKLTKATQGLVDSWKFVMSFQRLIRWMSSFAILGGAIAWLKGWY